MRTSRPLYRAVLKDAFALTLRQKHLWPLGLFAGALLSGSAYDLIARSWNVIIGAKISGRAVGGIPESVLLLIRTLSDGGPGGERAPLGFVLAAILFLLFLGALIWLSVVSQGALLRSVAADEENKRVSLQTSFTEGMAHFWPLFGVNLLMRAGVAAVVFALGAIFVPAALQNEGLWNLFAVLSFIILIPVAFLAVTVAFFSAMEIVRFESSFLGAIQNAMKLVRKHWLVVLETSAIVFAIDALAALLLVLAGVLYAAPFLLLFLASGILGSTVAYWIVLLLFLGGLAALLMIALSAIITYHYAVWGILLERLRKGSAVAKVLRVGRLLTNVLRPR